MAKCSAKTLQSVSTLGAGSAFHLRPVKSVDIMDTVWALKDYVMQSVSVTHTSRICLVYTDLENLISDCYKVGFLLWNKAAVQIQKSG